METNAPLQYIGYARKSSEDNKERQAASLPDQLFIIEGIKAKLHLSLKETLQESQTAFKTGRPYFNRMLQQLENEEANAILTWHANRLARNMRDGGQIIDLMDTGKLLEIRTPSRIYRNTPEDKWMLTVEFANSKKESDDKSIVVNRGLEKKARDGWRPGMAPVGYLNDKSTESGLRRILLDQERFPYVQQIFKMFCESVSVREIHRIAKDEWHFTTRQQKRMGGKNLTISMIYFMLSNPFYCGKFEYPVGSGKWYEGRHQKAVTEEIFNQIQVKLGKRSQYKFQHKEFAYSALVRCGHCDSGIVSEEKWQVICSACKTKFGLTRNNKDTCICCGKILENMKDPKILHYIYYRCGRKKKVEIPCNEKSLEVKKLERLIDEKLSMVKISPIFMEWAIKQIHKMNEADQRFADESMDGIKRAHDSVRSKLSNLLQLKISPTNADGSLLSDGQYKDEKTKLEKELKDIEKQLVLTDEKIIEANTDIERAFNFMVKARERFAQGDNKTKRDIFMGLGLNLTLMDGKVSYNSPKYIQTIEKMKIEAPVIAEMVEPGKEIGLTTKMEALYASIPSVLRGRESDPA